MMTLAGLSNLLAYVKVQIHLFRIRVVKRKCARRQRTFKLELKIQMDFFENFNLKRMPIKYLCVLLFA